MRLRLFLLPIFGATCPGLVGFCVQFRCCCCRFVAVVLLIRGEVILLFGEIGDAFLDEALVPHDFGLSYLCSGVCSIYKKFLNKNSRKLSLPWNVQKIQTKRKRNSLFEHWQNMVL